MDDVATQNSAPNPDHHRRKLSDLADVMVHLDHTLEDEVRIAHAEVIATMCRAHLTEFLGQKGQFPSLRQLLDLWIRDPEHGLDRPRRDEVAVPTDDDNLEAGQLEQLAASSSYSLKGPNMSHCKQSTRHPSFELASTMLRIWAVGFILAAKGTACLARKMFRSKPGTLDQDQSPIG